MKNGRIPREILHLAFIKIPINRKVRVDDDFNNDNQILSQISSAHTPTRCHG